MLLSGLQDMAHKPSNARINKEQGSRSLLAHHRRCPRRRRRLWSRRGAFFSSALFLGCLTCKRLAKRPAFFIGSVRWINSCWFDSKTALITRTHRRTHNRARRVRSRSKANSGSDSVMCVRSRLEEEALTFWFSAPSQRISATVQ